MGIDYLVLKRTRRHREVAERLDIQVADAAKWRDQILEYFGGICKRPVPPAI
jgi:alpha-glucuronidase